MDHHHQQHEEAPIADADAGAGAEEEEDGDEDGWSWDGPLIGGTLLNGAFRLLSDAAVAVIGFLGQQARQLAAAVAAHAGAPPQEVPPRVDGPMHMRVWYAVWDGGAAANRASMEAAARGGGGGGGGRPRRSRRPAQPPGLASQALRELERCSEVELATTTLKASATATATGTPPGAGSEQLLAATSTSDGAVASGHALAQLTCSQASTAVCAAAAAALTRAAAAAAATAAAATAATANAAERKSTATAPTAPSTDGAPLAPSTSQDMCLRITDYTTPGVALGSGVAERGGGGGGCAKTTHQKLTLAATSGSDLPPPFAEARLAFAEEPKQAPAVPAPAITTAPAPASPTARQRLLL